MHHVKIPCPQVFFPSQGADPCQLAPPTTSFFDFPPVPKYSVPTCTTYQPFAILPFVRVSNPVFQLALLKLPSTPPAITTTNDRTNPLPSKLAWFPCPLVFLSTPFCRLLNRFFFLDLALSLF